MSTDLAKPVHRCGPGVDAWRKLRAWYRGPVGRTTLAAERQQLDAVLADLFGYHLLQVGRLGDEDLLAKSRVRHRVILDADPEVGTPPAGCDGLVGAPNALPLASDSLDVLLLAHALEFEVDPHRLLREAERALIPEGHLILLGFNPWSLWSLWRLAGFWRARVPWCGNCRGVSRLKDWLRLLGFDIVSARTFFFRPPLGHAKTMERLKFLERIGARWWPMLGGCYLIVARKRVVTLTPVRPRWRPRRSLVPGLTEPSAHGRGMNCAGRAKKEAP